MIPFLDLKNINVKYKKYFYFGISTEKNGQYLNEDLISFKESFGARATLCDFYKIKL